MRNNIEYGITVLLNVCRLMLFVNRLLDAHPTTIQEDNELIKRPGGLGRRLAFAVSYRRSEKVVLHMAMQKTVDMWNSLLLKGVDERLT